RRTRVGSGRPFLLTARPEPGQVPELVLGPQMRQDPPGRCGSLTPGRPPGDRRDGRGGERVARPPEGAVLHPTRNIRFLVAVFGPVALVGGAPSAPVPKDAGPPVDYFPTKVGTRWVYEVRGEEPAEVVEEVVSVEEKDGVRVVTLRVEHKGVDPETK